MCRVSHPLNCLSTPLIDTIDNNSLKAIFSEPLKQAIIIPSLKKLLLTKTNCLILGL